MKIFMMTMLFLSVNGACNDSGLNSSTTDKTKLMDRKPLDTIVELAGLKASNLKDIKKVFDCSFKKDLTTSTDYIEVYIGKVDFFKNIEFRLPLEGNTTMEVLIILALEDNVMLTKNKIRNRFGNQYIPEPPSPTNNTNPLTYWKYALNESEVNFGFPLRGEDRLNKVVLKYTK